MNDVGLVLVLQDRQIVSSQIRTQKSETINLNFLHIMKLFVLSDSGK